MWRQAVSELRLHPGRFVATLIAVAISVGFIAAISVFVNTEQSALGKANVAPLSRADLYVNASGSDSEGLVAAVEAVDGVRAVHPVPMAMQVVLTHEDQSVLGMIHGVPHADLQWFRVVEGRLPSGEGEIALSRAGLDALGAEVGETVSPDNQGETEFTVVGATDDPKSLWSAVGYHHEAIGPDASEYAVVLDDGVRPEAIVDEVSAAAATVHPEIGATPAQEIRDLRLRDLTNDFDAFRYLLQAFGAVALLVGTITIANTFAILVAQRRRQIGLLRAVGASPGQVIGRLLAESFLLGLVGSLLGIVLGFGVAAIGGTITGSLYWGFDVRWGELAVALCIGTLATVASAVLPALRAAQVKPLEALQPVPTAEQARRAGIARIVVVVLTALVGIGLVVMSRIQADTSLLWAIGAGVFLTIAVLGAAPFFVPPLLRGVGTLFARFGPTPRLAFANAARNPKRAAATATALMLAVGLIVTLQVALATARTSGTESILAAYPVDFVVGFGDGDIPADLPGRLREVPSVDAVSEAPAKAVEQTLFIDQNGLLRGMGKDVPADAAPAAGEVVVSSFNTMGAVDGERVAFPTADGGSLTLTVMEGRGLRFDQASVTGETLERLAGDDVTRDLWVTLRDRRDVAGINQVMKVLETVPQADFSASGAGAILVLNQVLDVMLIVLTGLLGVAVVIALVGVSNTLGLSVIERQRESALLRALGMQRSGLRLMLLVEAVALVAVGVLVGMAAGMLFGWLGVSSTLLMIPGDEVQLHFSIDVGYTAMLILVCLAAAVLASLLPGQKAASATPTEALAAE